MGFDESELEGSESELDLESQIKPTIPNLSEPDNLPIFEDQVIYSANRDFHKYHNLIFFQLLDGLQNWLDRLFEGSTYRYHINYWPEFPISPANFNARSQ